MPITQSREISAAARLDNVRYAIRDLACIADEVSQQGHKVLALNVGDPNIFDFKTPDHLIEAVYKAMRDGKNGYAPSSGIKQALDAIRLEAARKGISTVQDVFVTTGVSESQSQKSVVAAGKADEPGGVFLQFPFPHRAFAFG